MSFFSIFPLLFEGDFFILNTFERSLNGGSRSKTVCDHESENLAARR